MDELKKQLADMCRSTLDYYEVVEEIHETVNYGLVIDFLFDCLADLMQNKEVKK